LIELTIRRLNQRFHL